MCHLAKDMVYLTVNHAGLPGRNGETLQCMTLLGGTKDPSGRPDQPSRDVCCLGDARIQDVVQRLSKPVQPSDSYPLILFHLGTNVTARGNQSVHAGGHRAGK